MVLSLSIQETSRYSSQRLRIVLIFSYRPVFIRLLKTWTVRRMNESRMQRSRAATYILVASYYLHFLCRWLAQISANHKHQLQKQR
jgi:hypothetical protein